MPWFLLLFSPYLWHLERSNSLKNPGKSYGSNLHELPYGLLLSSGHFLQIHFFLMTECFYHVLVRPKDLQCCFQCVFSIQSNGFHWQFSTCIPDLLSSRFITFAHYPLLIPFLFPNNQSWLIFKKMCVRICVCVCVRARRSPQKQKESTRSLEQELQAVASLPTWMWGNKLGSFGRAGRAFNHQATSPAPWELACFPTNNSKQCVELFASKNTVNHVFFVIYSCES